MAASDETVEFANLRGNTDVPVVSFPKVHGVVRRSDPDGSHSQPYWTGLAGTALQVVSGVVSAPVTTTVNFTTNNYADAVAAVNAAAPTEFVWVEADGFACIQSVHQGGKYGLGIAGGTAAAILGFQVIAAPGSLSLAGDIESSPPDRLQQNMQGTALLAHGENITTQNINRAILGMLQGARQKLNDLDKEFTIYNLILCSQHNSVNPANSSDTFVVPSNSSFRVSIPALTGLGADFGSVVTIADSVNKRAVIQSGLMVKATFVTYGPSDQGAPHGTSITWGTPGLGGNNGVDIGQAGVARSLKLGPTNISSLAGAQLKATGAQFVTKKVMPNDHFKITGATNNTPFNHNGEYAVVAVVDEDTITYRPLGPSELLVDSGNDTPSWMNPKISGGQVYGQISVYVGNGMRASGPSGAVQDTLFIKTSGSFSAGTQVYIRLPVVTTLRKMLIGDLLENTRWDPDIALVDALNYFTKQATFKSGVVLKTVASVAGTPQPRSKSDWNADDTEASYILLNETVPTNALSEPVRIYQRQSAIFITVNAYWDGPTTSWVQDHGTRRSTRFDFSEDSLSIQSMPAGTAFGTVVTDTWPSQLITLNSYDIRNTGGLNTALVNNTRISTPAGGNATADSISLMWSFTGADVSALPGRTSGTNIITRIYSSVKTSGLIFTVNARWDATNWNVDVGGASSLKISFTNGLDILFHTGSTPWTDAQWDASRQLKLDFADLAVDLSGVPGTYKPLLLVGDYGIQGIAQTSDTGSPKPLLVLADNNYVRQKSDYLGMPVDSDVGRFDWNWSKDVGAAQTASPIVVYPEWVFTRTGTGGTYTWAPPDGTGDSVDGSGFSFRSPFLQLNLSNTNGEDEFAVSSVIFGGYDPGSYVIEWDMMLIDPVTVGKYNYYAGITTEATGFRSIAAPNSYAYFQVTSAVPTALSVIGQNATGTNANNTVLSSAFNKWERYRLELHPGSNNPYGHALLRFYKSGANAGHITGASVPSGGTFRFSWGAKCVDTGAPASKRMNVGNVRVRWAAYNNAVGAAASLP